MKNIFFKASFFFFLILFLKPFNLYSQSRASLLVQKAQIFENYQWRKDLLAKMKSPINQLKNYSQIFGYENETHKVRFEIRIEKNAAYFLFFNQQNGLYPEAAKGNFLIKRNLASGRFEYFKVFYRDDDGCYFEIRPKGKEAEMAVYLFWQLQAKEILIPLSFEECLTLSFSKLIELSWGRVDWENLLYMQRRQEDLLLQNIAQTIQSKFKEINAKEDGAQDSSGRFVKIANNELQEKPYGFNCSGFVKWVVDGFYYPLTGKLLDLEILKQRHLDLRGNRLTQKYEEQRDPFFGLDWIRNCAVQLYLAQTKSSSLPANWRDVEAVTNYYYVKNIGFKITDLKQVLFYLAIQNPGIIYLAAINYISEKKPLYLAYYHVAVIIPFFDEKTEFRILVFDQHKNTDFINFLGKYKNETVFLTKIDATTGFIPIPLWN